MMIASTSLYFLSEVIAIFVVAAGRRQYTSEHEESMGRASEEFVWESSGSVLCSWSIPENFAQDDVWQVLLSLSEAGSGPELLTVCVFSCTVASACL